MSSIDNMKVPFSSPSQLIDSGRSLNTMLQQEHLQKKSVSEFAADSLSLVRKVHATKQPLLLTDNDENTAVVIDSAEYDIMAERMQMLEDIYLSQEQLRSGKGIPHETVEKDLLTRFGE